jgi:hypothetical protein
MPAEILDLAHGVNACYIVFFQHVGENGHVTYPFRKPGWPTYQHFCVLTQRVLENS